MAKRNRAAAIENQEVIYDDGYTSVVKTDNGTAPVPPPDTPFEPKPVSVVDMLDTLAGYVIPVINMGTGTNEKGECLLCGKSTAYEKRKLCVDCMQKYGKSYYERAKVAVENGETVIE